MAGISRVQKFNSFFAAQWSLSVWCCLCTRVTLVFAHVYGISLAFAASFVSLVISFRRELSALAIWYDSRFSQFEYAPPTAITFVRYLDSRHASVSHEQKVFSEAEFPRLCTSCGRAFSAKYSRDRETMLPFTQSYSPGRGWKGKLAKVSLPSYLNKSKAKGVAYAWVRSIYKRIKC